MSDTNLPYIPKGNHHHSAIQDLLSPINARFSLFLEPEASSTSSPKLDIFSQLGEESKEQLLLSCNQYLLDNSQCNLPKFVSLHLCKHKHHLTLTNLHHQIVLKKLVHFILFS